MSSGRLNGKVALITGATSGIGAATAELFASEGATVVLAGRSEERGRAAAERIGKSSIFVRADVSREEDIANVIAVTVERFGRLDVLFNNAGANVAGSVETVTQADIRNAMDLLVGSVLLGMKHAAPVMKAQKRGAIINNSSVAALRTGLGHYVYSVAKASVTHATRYAGMVLGRHGISVNSISPGAVLTPIFLGGADVAGQLEPAHLARRAQKAAQTLATQNPLRRAGQPEDVAHAALFLASDAGAYVNCHDLVVDGGMTAGGKLDYGE